MSADTDRCCGCWQMVLHSWASEQSNEGIRPRTRKRLHESAQEFLLYAKPFKRHFYANSNITTICTNDFPPEFWRVAVAQISQEDCALFNPTYKGIQQFFLKFNAVSVWSGSSFKAMCSFPGSRALSVNKLIIHSFTHSLLHSTSHVPDTMLVTVPWSRHSGGTGNFTSGSWGQEKSGDNTNPTVQQGR